MNCDHHPDGQDGDGWDDECQTGCCPHPNGLKIWLYVSSNSSWCQLTFLKGNEQFHLVSSFVLNHIGAAGIKARTQQMAMPILILLYFSGSDVVEFDLRGNC